MPSNAGLQRAQRRVVGIIQWSVVVLAAALPACGSNPTTAVTDTVVATTSTSSVTPVTTTPVTSAASARFGPGTYAVPNEMPFGIYEATNVPGAFPGCIWTTYTRDGTPIDVYNMTFEDGPFTIEVLSPAIATFESSNSCTPFKKIR
jgi:hypothetical protein